VSTCAACPRPAAHRWAATRNLWSPPTDETLCRLGVRCLVAASAACECGRRSCRLSPRFLPRSRGTRTARSRGATHLDPGISGRRTRQATGSTPAARDGGAGTDPDSRLRSCLVRSTTPAPRGGPPTLRHARGTSRQGRGSSLGRWPHDVYVEETPELSLRFRRRSSAKGVPAQRQSGTSSSPGALVMSTAPLPSAWAV